MQAPPPPQPPAGLLNRACTWVGNYFGGEPGNIVLLMLLYTLQGLPLGIAGAVPIMLKDAGATNTDLAEMSLAFWPFSIKLLWAPIVDSKWIPRFGRRKTWLVPVQLLIGWILCKIQLLHAVQSKQVSMLSVGFFFLTLLAATQDIAVDGWALSMLKEANAGWAATCNTVGQTLGFLVGITGIFASEQVGWGNADAFCRKTGSVFIAVTLAVAVLKREKAEEPAAGDDSAAAAYGTMVRMLRLAPVRQLTAWLLLWKLPFASITALAVPKLQVQGLPKEHVASLTTAMTPLGLLLPMLLAPLTHSARPLDLAAYAWLVRLLLVPIGAIVIANAPNCQGLSSTEWGATPECPVPVGFYAAGTVLEVFEYSASTVMFVAQISLFAKVSDPRMGGTYMTMFNTIANLGGMWPNTAALYLSGKIEAAAPEYDSFSIVSAVLFVGGLIWFFFWGYGAMARTQDVPRGQWLLPQ
eukprot:TRINITY_DN55537_c0_g1_i1.p1 TRINITY_DN55537_c0_g1~~TRINITY_DN55537_c0_g1_i1.p1  ORF type:complete len:510 (+),score=126.28 TRINITY_DN55537_c0_g1_i1:127-1530(+)